MDAADLFKIINACRKAKVERLKVDELELIFFPGDAAKIKRAKVDAEKPLTSEELERANKTALNERTNDAIEDELATLQIDDPEAYERLLIERELEFGHESAEEATQD